MRCPAGEVDSEGEVHVLRHICSRIEGDEPRAGDGTAQTFCKQKSVCEDSFEFLDRTPIRPGRVCGRTLKLRESPCVPVGVSFVSWALTQSKCR